MQFMAPLKPFDVLICSGRSPVSRFIRCMTCSPWSHVAIVAKSLTEEIPDTLIFESTSQSPLRCILQGKLVSGVQAHKLGQWLRQYPGKVYVMRFTGFSLFNMEESEKRFTDQLMSLINNCKEKHESGEECEGKGTSYDGFGAFLAGTRIVKWLPCLVDRLDSRQAQFCVEMNESSLRCALPVLRSFFDPGRHRPRDHVRALLKTRSWNKPEQIK